MYDKSYFSFSLYKFVIANASVIYIFIDSAGLYTILLGISMKLTDTDLNYLSHLLLKIMVSYFLFF